MASRHQHEHVEISDNERAYVDGVTGRHLIDRASFVTRRDPLTRNFDNLVYELFANNAWTASELHTLLSQMYTHFERLTDHARCGEIDNAIEHVEYLTEASQVETLRQYPIPYPAPSPRPEDNEEDTEDYDYSESESKNHDEEEDDDDEDLRLTPIQRRTPTPAQTQDEDDDVDMLFTPPPVIRFHPRVEYLGTETARPYSPYTPTHTPPPQAPLTHTPPRTPVRDCHRDPYYEGHQFVTAPLSMATTTPLPVHQIVDVFNSPAVHAGQPAPERRRHHQPTFDWGVSDDSLAFQPGQPGSVVMTEEAFHRACSRIDFDAPGYGREPAEYFAYSEPSTILPPPPFPLTRESYSHDYTLDGHHDYSTTTDTTTAMRGQGQGQGQVASASATATTTTTYPPRGGSPHPSSTTTLLHDEEIVQLLQRLHFTTH